MVASANSRVHRLIPIWPGIPSTAEKVATHQAAPSAAAGYSPEESRHSAVRVHIRIVSIRICTIPQYPCRTGSSSCAPL